MGFDCGSSNVQKQSVQCRLFRNVVLRLSAPSYSKDIVAEYADASAKIRIIFRVYNDLPQFYTLFNRIAQNRIINEP